MSKAAPRSPWRLPLVREITAILLIKLALLLGIKAIWFDQPTLPENGTERLDSHLFSRPATPSSPLAEETPR
ncbi:MULTISPECIES: cytochrome oxidase putative small subunit CydP [Pseudomonadaceae]|uniref:Cytochrome oxidase putative small subunit CydP n=1 Tax=Ectopseudomonas mendocina TaxID=300 RepID=A0ABZ2RHX1_ECTME|nr:MULTISPECIES: cytochrome oxidase putative small subunit CydP [Pseudomonas aeruginosa group]